MGDAALTGAGTLAVRHVIHAAAMGDEPVSETSIRNATAASLRLAAREGMRRVAFPVLGSGVGGFDFEHAAQLMLEVVETSPDAAALDEFVLYGFSEVDAERLRALVDARAAGTYPAPKETREEGAGSLSLAVDVFTAVQV